MRETGGHSSVFLSTGLVTRRHRRNWDGARRRRSRCFVTSVVPWRSVQGSRPPGRPGVMWDDLIESAVLGHDWWWVWSVG